MHKNKKNDELVTRGDVYLFALEKMLKTFGWMAIIFYGVQYVSLLPKV